MQLSGVRVAGTYRSFILSRVKWRPAMTWRGRFIQQSSSRVRTHCDVWCNTHLRNAATFLIVGDKSRLSSPKDQFRSFGEDSDAITRVHLTGGQHAIKGVLKFARQRVLKVRGSVLG